ncbi:uncharacterized protein A4U43_C02F6640 [Asparagus officinalis]|uniref:NAC domain-containing protein n=1 Tax=Asparagus officinalis TaxID=4686 RepID=A0A5P1FKI4_ASPOF|nr:uncharacterized protein A4U43_C02F6640 [Asparagus officinalis]
MGTKSGIFSHQETGNIRTGRDRTGQPVGVTGRRPEPIKPVGSPKPVAIKKALVFYAGKAPKGDKTNWIMHEYRLADVDRSARKKNSLRKPNIAPHVTSAMPPPPTFPPTKDFSYFGPSESLPMLHADSSCSSHVLSPDLTCESKEAESQLRWEELGRALGAPFNYGDATVPFPPLDCGAQFSNDPLQDLFASLQRPF